MRTYTYSEARQNLASLLDIAGKEGQIAIKRRDGTSFIIHPDKNKKSHLDVPGVETGLNKKDIIGIIREGRERSLNKKN